MKYKELLLEFFVLLILKSIKNECICFTVDTLCDSHLADALQIHGVNDHHIIIGHKLFVDGMVKWP